MLQAWNDTPDQLRDFVENSKDLIQIVSPEGAVLYANHSWKEALGFGGQEVAGRNIFEVLAPECRAHCVEMLGRLMRGEDVGLFSVTFVGAEGRRVEAEGNVSVRWEGGRPVHTRGIFRDVTALRSAEQALRDHTAWLERRVEERTAALERTRNQFETLFEFAPDALVLTDRRGSIRLVNRRALEMFGWTREELVGQPVTMLVCAGGGAWPAGGPGSGSGGADRLSAEALQGLRKGGAVFPAEVSLSPLQGSDGPMRVAAVRDITERWNAERRMNRTQRLEAIGQLAGGVAHDLNNALAPILVATAMLRDLHPGEEELIATMESSAERCAEMVQQLLTFARGSEGARVPVQPGQILREMGRIVRGTFPKNIELRMHIPADLAAVLGDATQIHQVLLNLCVNARDAMPSGGTLTLVGSERRVDETFASAVAEARPGDYVVLEVADTGCGIPLEIQERIFDPFFSTKAPDKGTGLGLSTVLGIVKGHSGFIRVQSSLGAGSRFEVYLPATRVEAGERNAGGRVEPVTAAFGRGRTVLVVDDELNIRNTLSIVLGRLGFEVCTAGDGEEALEVAGVKGVALSALVTDLNMPRMGGVPLVRSLRERGLGVPVIAATGRMEPGEERELRGLGVRAVLAKPYSQEHLVRALREVLEQESASGVEIGADRT